ncbi:unnamed protein product [Effrenium voratum]|nr:unnamed protein product [Effrenium voratum]
MAAALFCQDDFWNFSVGLKAMVYLAVLDSHRRCEEIARTKQTLLKYTQVFDKLAQSIDCAAFDLLLDSWLAVLAAVVGLTRSAEVRGADITDGMLSAHFGNPSCEAPSQVLNWVALLVPALVGWALEVDSGAYFQSLQRLADACREAAQELADVSDHSCLLEYILAVRAMLTQAQEDCITLGRVCAPASP